MFILTPLRCAVFAVAAVVTGAALAQTYPSRPIRFVVPQTPGGASDALARVTGLKLGDSWAQQFVIDNRGGAGGNIGTDTVAKSAPDGYTWLLAYVGTHAINAALYKKLPFDPDRDFAPVATLATLPFVVIVNNNLPVKNVQELIALAKTKPGGLSYGSAGSGSVNHLLGVMLNSLGGVNIVHVPYRGAAAALTDTMSGQVQMYYASMPSVVQHLRAGAVRAIAVTSAARSDALKDVPTIAESGFPGFDVNPWFGILVPAGTPAAVIGKINGDVNQMLAQKDVIDRFTNLGAVPFSTTPAQFSRIAHDDIVKWAKVVRESGATVD
jgi:tripartite-type tricarboxylate transporter receptor subunit TctC